MSPVSIPYYTKRALTPFKDINVFFQQQCGIISLNYFLIIFFNLFKGTSGNSREGSRTSMFSTGWLINLQLAGEAQIGGERGSLARVTSPSSPERRARSKGGNRGNLFLVKFSGKRRNLGDRGNFLFVILFV